MDIVQQIKRNAIKAQKCIVLPEGEEERTLKAADIILSEKLARLILLGNPDTIAEKAKGLNLNHIQYASIIDPSHNPQEDFYTNMLWEIRKNKGVSVEQAK
jgi:phosphate acetyltransferase